jgi:AcrR family transcriptional regulator
METENKDTEALILQAAEELFLERGFTKTTTALIAQRAGCNHALVHYYYRTKDKLFNRIFEEKARIILNNFWHAGKDGDTFEEKLTAKIRAHFDFLKENAKLLRFLYNEISTNPARIESVFEIAKKMKPGVAIEQTKRELEEEIRSGRIRPISIENLLLTMISLNISPFLLQPIFLSVFKNMPEQVNQFLEQRREENVRIILARLKP